MKNLGKVKPKYRVRLGKEPYFSIYSELNVSKFIALL